MNKATLLDAAEVFDSWRVVPRTILAAYAVLVGWVCAYIIVWYAHLDKDARTAQVSAFVSIVVPTVLGMSGFIFKIYSSAGRNWDAPNMPPVIVTQQNVVEK